MQESRALTPPRLQGTTHRSIDYPSDHRHPQSAIYRWTYLVYLRMYYRCGEEYSAGAAGLLYEKNGLRYLECRCSRACEAGEGERGSNGGVIGEAA
jgi:hypothetical protein